MAADFHEVGDTQIIPRRARACDGPGITPEMRAFDLAQTAGGVSR
jgi:hypothetical protein